MENKNWLILVLFLLTACGATNQIDSDTQHDKISLADSALESHGLAFITPSAATGSEEDIQALALVFSNELRLSRPNVRVVSLPETINAINKSGLSGPYADMFGEYNKTGILQKETLNRIAQAVNTRYFAQLKLAHFSQNRDTRLRIFGLRLFETKNANLRVFMQIWDSADGSVAWEGSEEISFSYDTGREKPIHFKFVAEIAARNLINRLSP